VALVRDAVLEELEGERGSGLAKDRLAPETA
jgi:hypothetical protein